MCETSQYFCGIGAQRAGTTWLSKYLENHPQVLMSPIKELHYFDRIHLGSRLHIQRMKKNVENLCKSIKMSENELISLEARIEFILMNNDMRYKLFFEKRLKEEKAFGEITPEYALLEKDGFEHIKKIFPFAKLIYILRNPADRIWSAIHLFCRNNNISIDKEVLGRMLKNALEKQNHFYLHTNYRRTLEVLKIVEIPVLVLFYEDLFSAEGEKEVRKITDFLGIDFIKPAFDKKINKATEKSMPNDIREKLIERYLFVYEYVKEYFGYLPESWEKDMEMVLK